MYIAPVDSGLISRVMGGGVRKSRQGPKRGRTFVRLIGNSKRSKATSSDPVKAFTNLVPDQQYR